MGSKALGEKKRPSWRLRLGLQLSFRCPDENLCSLFHYHLQSFSSTMALPRTLAVRSLVSLRSVARPSLVSLRLPLKPVSSSTRTYASKGKAKSTANIKPGSQMKLFDEAANQEYEKAEGVMKTAVEWFRKECAGYQTRATGRVTPAILAPVRVKIPGDSTDYPLEALGTVGVREGTTLLITLFEERVSCSLRFGVGEMGAVNGKY